MKPLAEVALLFLRLGATGFGGPAAHIAMMEDEVVRRRGWMDRAAFLDLLGATNLIPGPNSTEMAIHIGRVRAGWPGLVVAGVCFIVPAAAVVISLAWLYVRTGSLPEAGAVMRGVKPIMIAIVLQALYALGRTALRTWPLAAVAVASAAAVILGAHELTVLAAAGFLAVVARKRRPPSGVFFAVPAAAVPVVATATFNLGVMFALFLKIGAVLFGSGYVLLAYLRADLVERLRWMSEQQLLDAISVGQITPGPVLTTATFIGYVLGGVPAAVLATLAIFLPAFVFVALSSRLIPKLRRSPVAGSFLDGVNAASLALMAVVTMQLGRAAVFDVTTAAIALAGAVLLVTFRLNSVWLVLAGAAAGLLLL